jgi:hypothetical protein
MGILTISSLITSITLADDPGLNMASNSSSDGSGDKELKNLGICGSVKFFWKE